MAPHMHLWKQLKGFRRLEREIAFQRTPLASHLYSTDNLDCDKGSKFFFFTYNRQPLLAKTYAVISTHLPTNG